MSKKLQLTFLGLVFIGTSFYFYSCRNRDLRGWWRASGDGKTYLVVEDSDAGQCPPIWLNGEKLNAKIDEPIEVRPGEHEIICGEDSDPKQGIEFEVQPGSVYHFNYWGP